MVHCPICGKEAVKEGEHPEIKGLHEEHLAWFCFDCLVIKKLCQKRWVELSKDAIAVMVGTDVLEEKLAHYEEQWTWENPNPEFREWVKILDEEIKKRRRYTKDQLVNRLETMKIATTALYSGAFDEKESHILLNDGEIGTGVKACYGRFHVYDEGKWK